MAATQQTTAAAQIATGITGLLAPGTFPTMWVGQDGGILGNALGPTGTGTPSAPNPSDTVNGMMVTNAPFTSPLAAPSVVTPSADQVAQTEAADDLDPIESTLAQNAENLAAATSTGQAMQTALNQQLSVQQADEANAEITAGVNSEAQAPFEKILVGLGLATLLAVIFL